MYQFFKLMHEKASESDVEYKSIKDLTMDLALSAGYHREEVTLKNGNKVMRTKYNGWDDVLVAKWFCHFEKMFVGKLSQLNYLKDYHVTIIERTFTIFFNALQLNKIISNTSVTTTVYACFNNRIGEVMQEVVSESRMQRFNDKKGVRIKASKDRVNLNSYVNTSAVSLDMKIDEVHTLHDILYEENVKSDLILDIQKRLMGDELGLRLLDSLVYSDRQVSFGNIGKFIELSSNECNPSVVKRLQNAYKIIVRTIKEYYPNKDCSDALSKRLRLKNNFSLEMGGMEL